jgi:hypothetical protein
MVDRSLAAAAACFAGATVFGAVVSVREGVSGEPLGVRLPGPVPVQLAVGLGSGLSAPWPMPAAALVAALCAGSAERWPGPTCMIIGSMVLTGTLVEPATWGRRSDSRLVRAAVALNLLAGSALVTIGWRVARRA